MSAATQHYRADTYDYRDALRLFELRYLRRVLAASGTKAEAARLAGMGRTQLYRMLVRHGLHETHSEWLRPAGHRT